MLFVREYLKDQMKRNKIIHVLKQSQMYIFIFPLLWFVSSLVVIPLRLLESKHLENIFNLFSESLYFLYFYFFSTNTYICTFFIFISNIMHLRKIFSISTYHNPFSFLPVERISPPNHQVTVLEPCSFQNISDF